MKKFFLFSISSITIFTGSKSTNNSQVPVMVIGPWVCQRKIAEIHIQTNLKQLNVNNYSL